MNDMFMQTTTQQRRLKPLKQFFHTSVCVWFSSLLSQFINQTEVLSSNAVHH